MPTLVTLANFEGLNGETPIGDLLLDAQGNLFGTTAQGGSSGYGIAFEIHKTETGYALPPTTLVSFNGSDGQFPTGGLISDDLGNLFGTTQGTEADTGTIFELASANGSYTSTPTTLVSFNSADGSTPFGSLSADGDGDLFGTTSLGGTGDAGTVFEVQKTALGYANIPTTLLAFDGADGRFPTASLLVDSDGSLIGTTQEGGLDGLGTVFKVPNIGGAYSGTSITVASFNGDDGKYPQGGIVADSAGNLFGTTEQGGADGDGTVFEIVKTDNGYASTPVTLVSFEGTNGQFPEGKLIVDAAGNLFGTTSQGGAAGSGTIFEVPKTGNVYATTPTTVVNFNGPNGLFPKGGLVADSDGNLFGTTTQSTAPNTYGTVFEVAGADFQVVCYVRGTHILTDEGERLIENLMPGHSVMTLSDKGLRPRPVKWIGQRRINTGAPELPETLAPIRIKVAALAEEVPHRDLLVSPDHAIFVEGKLICARQLINGATIIQERGWCAVHYFHVELDGHAVLLAEGLPAESYLNTGNRGFFAGSAGPAMLRPDLTDHSDYPNREAGSCAPFVSDEASVRPIWQRLAERAVALGQRVPAPTTTSDAELHILAGERKVRPFFAGNGLYMFILPGGVSAVRVRSRAASPTHTRPWLEDRRRLGVQLARIVLRYSEYVLELALDHPDLTCGWWAVEKEGTAMRRWTNGDAILPLPILGESTILELQLGGSIDYVLSARASMAA